MLAFLAKRKRISMEASCAQRDFRPVGAAIVGGAARRRLTPAWLLTIAVLRFGSAAVGRRMAALSEPRQRIIALLLSLDGDSELISVARCAVDGSALEQTCERRGG